MNDSTNSAYLFNLKAWLETAYQWQTLQILPFVLPIQELYSPNQNASMIRGPQAANIVTTLPGAAPAAAAPEVATGMTIKPFIKTLKVIMSDFSIKEEFMKFQKYPKGFWRS